MRETDRLTLEKKHLAALRRATPKPPKLVYLMIGARSQAILYAKEHGILKSSYRCIRSRECLDRELTYFRNRKKQVILIQIADHAMASSVWAHARSRSDIFV